MRCDELVRLLDAGKKPTVVLTDSLWDDSWGQKGMVAVVSSHATSTSDLVDLTFDYNQAKEHNLSLQGHDWYIRKNGVDAGTGTAFEAGLMDESDVTESVPFEPDQDVPVSVFEDDTPLAEYLIHLRELGSDCDKPTYVEWLESQLKSLRQAAVVPEVRT